MKKRRILAAALGLALFPLLASSSQAQELSARYTKRFDNAQLSVSFGSGRSGGGHRGPSYAPSTAYGRSPIRRSRYSGRGYGYGRLWIPGRYEVVSRKVWVPGFSDRVWVEPVFDVGCDRYGNQVRVLVREGYHRTFQQPGRYELQKHKVWRPGHWTYR